MNILQARSTKIILVKHEQIPIYKLLSPKYVEDVSKLNHFSGASMLQDQTGNVVAIGLNNGLYNANDGKEIVINNLTIESRKINFRIEEVTGYADEYYLFIKKYLSGLSNNLQDDFLMPVISVDETELISNLNFSAQSLFSENLYNQMTENMLNTASVASNNLSKARLGGIQINFQIDYEPVDFALFADSRINVNRKEFTIQIATGYGVNDKVYFSKAPLNTDTHLKILADLEDALI